MRAAERARKAALTAAARGQQQPEEGIPMMPLGPVSTMLTVMGVELDGEPAIQFAASSPMGLFTWFMSPEASDDFADHVKETARLSRSDIVIPSGADVAHINSQGGAPK